MHVLSGIAHTVAEVIVFLGAVPLVIGVIQFLLIGLQRFRHLYEDRGDVYLPRTAILIPAWNEAPVLTGSVEALLALHYPADRLRVVIIDDASTDETPEVMSALIRRHPGQVRHLRREQGGQGKAHTLNHGLAHVLDDDWAEAVLVMDADVVFERDALWRMTRHLADPEVGAVTAYIKEGSGKQGNYLTRYIAYEYITAQAAARRAQNVLGVVACLAGGAQLHTRANLEAIGGRFDTSTLAEDTVTTFETQLAGRRVVFDGYATVLAEEPASLAGLWKQRLRWARGNLQVTRRYRDVWFRGRTSGGTHRLGSFLFGLIWFSLLATPVLLVACSASLLFLYFSDSDRAWLLFHVLWVINLICYLLITLLSAVIDPSTFRRSWFEALIYPGAIAICILVITALPGVFVPLLDRIGLLPQDGSVHPVMIAVYAWLALSMPIAWCAKLLTGTRLRWLAPPLLHLAGYGSLLAACLVASFVQEMRHAQMTWDKTEKTGKVAAPR
ncbi:glycosyltransferase family 2 protein [Streptomyces sp. HUAS MG91]|uniref:Glycosyltransferase family 2 protein n=1 Tax=Streptomyces tabacisoli TaxID=3156398 RepID=A0AAU8ILU3_9ACTN